MVAVPPAQAAGGAGGQGSTFDSHGAGGAGGTGISGAPGTAGGGGGGAGGGGLGGLGDDPVSDGGAGGYGAVVIGLGLNSNSSTLAGGNGGKGGTSGFGTNGSGGDGGIGLLFTNPGGASFQNIGSISGGTGGALSISGRGDMTSRSGLGAQLDGRTRFGAVPVTGFVRAAWAHYFQRDASLTASLIALPGASFSASGARPDRDGALIAAGLDAGLTERVSLGMRLDSELSANTRSLGGTARLVVSF